MVVDDIRLKIETAHFGIIDVTGYNPNVMWEFGMLRALEKRFILISNKEDESVIPFDLRPFHHYKYEKREDKLYVADPASNQLKLIDEVLLKFIKKLMTIRSFQKAKPFLGAISS